MAKWVNLDDCVEISIGDMNFYPVELLGDVYEDVAPVVHAHWEEHVYSGGKLFFKCSECGHWVTPAHGHTYNYCFCCGAKMDEEIDDA